MAEYILHDGRARTDIDSAGILYAFDEQSDKAAVREVARVFPDADCVLWRMVKVPGGIDYDRVVFDSQKAGAWSPSGRLRG